MSSTETILAGRHIRLEPLQPAHAAALAAASAGDPELYRWSPVPQGPAQAQRYVQEALQARDAGTALPLAVLRQADGAVIGSTRYFLIERWAWPPGHPRQGRAHPDACEIGYTWYAREAIRTAANTEAKWLMLAQAFDTWGVLRVCLHTDVRNQRSRAAIERIGGRFEGILRSHRLAADFGARDSARYSILAAEWPQVREQLQARVAAALHMGANTPQAREVL